MKSILIAITLIMFNRGLIFAAVPTISIGVDPDNPSGSSEFRLYYQANHVPNFDGGETAVFKISRPPGSEGALFKRGM